MRRIKRAKNKESLYQSLGGAGGTDKLFDSMKDVFMFAAALGFARGERKPLEGGVEVFGPTVFSQDDLTMLYLMAIADAEEIDILHPEREEELVTIIEEYANAGIDHLANSVLNSPGEALDNLITLVGREANSYSQPPDIVDRIAERFLPYQ